MGCGSSRQHVHPKPTPLAEAATPPDEDAAAPDEDEDVPVPARAPTPPPRIKATVVFVIAPPAVKTSALCERISDRFGYIYISMADLLRDEAQGSTAREHRIAEVMAAGSLVSDDVVVELLHDAIDSTVGPRRHFLIAGFPRTVAQAAAFERAICEPAFVLSLEANDAGSVVTGDTAAPEGSSAVGAAVATDAVAHASTRLQAYQSQTQPVVARYSQLGVTRRVDVGGRPADDVFVEISGLFEAQRSHEEEGAAVRTGSNLRRPASSATVATEVVDASSLALEPTSAATVVFVVGPPAVGKGLQCGLLRKAGFGFTHLSTGYLLRMEVAKGSALGAEVAAVMAAGGVVPDEAVLRLLCAAVEAAPGPHRRVLIDGFPISLAQAAAFEAAVCAPVCVLALDAPEAALEARAVERARTSGRDDDNVPAFRRRLASYREQTLPVLARYETSGAVRRVDASGSAEDVASSIAAVFESLGLCRHEPVLVQVGAAGANKSLRIAGTATPDRAGGGSGGGGPAGRRASFSLKASAGGASGDEATLPSRVRFKVTEA